MTVAAPSTSSISLGPGALLIAPDTPLPPQWRLENSSIARGWSRVAHPFDHIQLEKELGAAGWSFFFMAGAITATAFGLNRQRLLDAALARLIAAARRQRCNGLEIDGVGMRSFFGIQYVSISAHPRHIQKGMVFYGQTA
jgi:hypothetical protein